ncbi:MAG: SCO family protein [Candidatus Solibacter sp.]
MAQTLVFRGLSTLQVGQTIVFRGLSTLLIGAFLLLASCVKVTPLPVLGEIPQFQLTLQTDQPFDSQTLDGHIWVANFIYTNCDGPCPMMSHQMRGIQNSTAATPDLKLVSFTVDPARDTPPVLAKYATHFMADYSRWYFLTGEMERLNDLGVKAFKMNSVDGSMSHSTRFVLVDRKRRIRGFYLTTDDTFPKNLLHDIRQLQSDAS